MGPFARPPGVAALAAAMLVGGCHDTSLGPTPSRELVVAVGGEGASIFVINPASASVVDWPGPVPRIKGPAALAPDRAMLYFVAGDQTGAWLYVVDMQTFSLASWLQLNSSANFHAIDSLWIGGRAIAFSPDGRRMFLGAAYRENPFPKNQPPPDAERVAVLDIATRRLVGLSGPLTVHDGGLAMLPAGPTAPHGAILAIGMRSWPLFGPSQSSLFVLDPATLAVADSATVNPPNPSYGGTLRQVLPAPDGRAVYLVGLDGMLYKYDLVERRVAASTPFGGPLAAASTPFGGTVAIAPDGQHLYGTDVDQPALPGPGTISIFGPNLERLGSIDLREAAAVRGNPPTLGGLAVSHDGQRLYVAAGSPAVGLDYSGQPLQILVVDLATRKLVSSIPLDDFGGAALFVR